MAEERRIWLGVAYGIESLAGKGPQVWNEPPAVAQALRELLSVLPATHVQIDLARLRARSEPAAEWTALLLREADWGTLLAELVAAVADSVRGRAAWGLGLPAPDVVAAALGDASERGVLKAAVQLAGFLQAFRTAGLDFVAVDLAGGAAAEKAIAPIFRNAQMYGWRQAAIVGDEVTLPDAAIRLLAREALPASFWTGDTLAPASGDRTLLFGPIPPGIDAAAIVAAGRRLQRWRDER